MIKNKSIFWFSVLVTYVVIQFVWWSYLMFELNNEIYTLKTELNLLKGASPEEVVVKGNELNVKLHNRWVMIVGEAVVFIGALTIGIFQVLRSFKKEVELTKQQQNFLLSVTHELKSPIASAKLQLQTLYKHELDRKKQLEIIADAINDTERLNNLVENILLAAKIENGIYQLHKEQCNLSEYVFDGMQQTIRSFNYKNTIKLNIEPNLFLEIDKTTFPSIVLNLVENAVKYSELNSEIIVELKKENQKIILRISDNGVGISENDKKKIFEKFYRSGDENTRKTKGTGLGLYIVDYIVKEHGGIISVKNNVPKGTIFEIRFT